MTLSQEQKSEIASTRERTRMTRRPCVQALEEKLYEAIPVLNRGFVRCLDYMGDDAAIVQAARVSYGGGTKTVSEDAKLISYLLGHGHTTPFEMCEIKFHVTLPIFIARQWIRHRTANVNEVSARYSILNREFYIPNPVELELQDPTNKQGRSGRIAQKDQRQIWDWLTTDAANAYDHYEEMTEKGLARELARMNLPVNIYTEWYWKIDLHNLFHFLNLRTDSHAQKEIRLYAMAMLSLVRRWVPMAVDAWEDQVVGGCHLNTRELEFVRRMAMGSGDQLDATRRILKDQLLVGEHKGGVMDEIKMTSREWSELRLKIVGGEIKVDIPCGVVYN